MKYFLGVVFLFSVIGNYMILTVNNVNDGIKKVLDDKVIVYNNDTIKKFSYLKHPDRNQLFITVRINGKKAYFMLDTGATITLLDKDQLSNYKLSSRETDREYGGIGGTNMLYDVNRCDTVEIEGVKFNQKLYASDIHSVVEATYHNSHVHILGILGSDFFSEHNAVFDYNRKIFFVKN